MCEFHRPTFVTRHSSLSSSSWCCEMTANSNSNCDSNHPTKQFGYFFASRKIIFIALVALLSCDRAVPFSYRSTPRLSSPWSSRGASPHHHPHPITTFNNNNQSSFPSLNALRSSSESRDLEDNNNMQPINSSFPKLSIGYKALSFGYAFQVWLAIVKSTVMGGPALAAANAIGGPLAASGILFYISKNNCNFLSSDVVKQLNGLLTLYASLGLTMVALLPPTSSFFEWLWFACSSGVLIICSRGYTIGALSSAPKANYSFKEKSRLFLKETLRLNKESQQAVWGTPTNVPSAVYSLALPVILLMKLSLGVELYQLTSKAASGYALVGRISQLAKLTILGGSTVILKSLALKTKPSGEETRVISKLQLFTSYIYLTTAGECYSFYDTNPWCKSPSVRYHTTVFFSSDV